MLTKLAARLVKDFPDVLNITKLTSYQFTFKDSQVFNTNKMIYSLNENIKLQGVDGLQTSFQLTVIIVLLVQQNLEILD